MKKHLNTISIVIAVFCVLSIFADYHGIASSIFMLLAAFTVSPFIKKLIPNKPTKKLRIILPIIFFSIAAFLGESYKKTVSKESELAKVTEQQITVKQNALNEVLKPLTYCDVIYSSNYNDSINALIKKNTHTYLKQNSITDSLYAVVLTYSDECLDKRIKERQRQLHFAKRGKEIRKEKVEKCYNKICEELYYSIRKTLHNPKSFEYVDCKYIDSKDNTLQIAYSYKGENALGAIRLATNTVTVDIESCKVISIE